jgi:hypothetical protein
VPLKLGRPPSILGDASGHVVREIGGNFPDIHIHLGKRKSRESL